jgi:hypothetical protein
MSLLLLFPGSVGSVARPVADVSAGPWTASSGAALFDMLDETVADDLDYIVTTMAGTCTLALGPATAPNPGKVMRLRYRASSATAATLIARLKQGSTVIASATHTNVPAVPTEFTLTLTAAEAAAITDFSALRIDLVGQ